MKYNAFEMAMLMAFTVVTQHTQEACSDVDMSKEERLLYIQAMRTLNGFLRMTELRVSDTILEDEEDKYSGRKPND